MQSHCSWTWNRCYCTVLLILEVEQVILSSHIILRYRTCVTVQPHCSWTLGSVTVLDMEQVLLHSVTDPGHGIGVTAPVLILDMEQVLLCSHTVLGDETRTHDFSVGVGEKQILEMKLMLVIFDFLVIGVAMQLHCSWIYSSLLSMSTRYLMRSCVVLLTTFLLFTSTLATMCLFLSFQVMGRQPTILASRESLNFYTEASVVKKLFDKDWNDFF